MRMTQIRKPFPVVGCLPDDFHPTNYIHTPPDFLLLRPPAYREALLEECRADGDIDDCEAYVTLVEDQWHGRYSAFDEGELIPSLRTQASLAATDALGALAEAAKVAADGNIVTANALADLVVSGQAAFSLFRASPPSRTQVAERLLDIHPGLAEPERLTSAGVVLDRAYRVAHTLHTGFERSDMGWIAVSGVDDPPHRPTNVPGSAYPQFDLEVTVRPGNYHPEMTVRTRAIVAKGEPPPPSPPDQDRLPEDPEPAIEPEERLIVFIHGHSSRLEECDTLLHPLIRRGFTVVAMDLPSCGYAAMIDHAQIGPIPRSDRDPFPVLDFLEQFIIDFIHTLGDRVGRDISDQVSAMIGGSLGGNLSLRLARRDPFEEHALTNFVPWSPASVWTAASGLRAIGTSTGTVRAQEPESGETRRLYFYHVFYHNLREYTLRPQPEYWYRDDDYEPCKTRLITGARADRQEIYNTRFRQWHWRLAVEQLFYSHRRARTHNSGMSGRLLLTSGTGDNYPFTHIHNATTELGAELISTPGRLLSLDHTGHSIYIERPEELARHIASFVPSARPPAGEEAPWTGWQSLGGSSFSAPAVGTQEEGRLDVFTLNSGLQVQHITQLAPRGGWGAWRTLAGGLNAADRFRDSIAVGYNQDGRLELFATLLSPNWLAHVWQNAPNGDWHAWDKGNHISQLIGGATAGVAVADRIADGPSRALLAIARRDNGRIHIRGQNRLGSWWLGGDDLGQEGLSFTGRPWAAYTSKRLMQLFARDTGGELWRIWENWPDSWHYEWVSLGGVVAGDPVAALDTQMRTRLFVAGPGGDVLTIAEERPVTAFRVPEGSWGSWGSLGGELAAGSRPAVHRDAWGRLQLFVRWRDGSIRTRRQLDSDATRWSDWFNLEGNTNRDFAVTQDIDGTLCLFIVGRDGQLYTNSQFNPYREDGLFRGVAAVQRSGDGEVIALCAEDFAWPTVSVSDAIRDIETGAYIYFIEMDGRRIDLIVVDDPSGKYLHSDPAETTRNILVDMPDC